jgi:hypothetical protein
MSSVADSLYDLLAQRPALCCAVGETVTTRQKETLDNDAEALCEFGDALEVGAGLLARLGEPVPAGAWAGETRITKRVETVDEEEPAL